MTIKAGSHSRIVVFEQCKFHAKLSFVDRVPEPPRPLPPGKTEHANDRGERIHKAAEKYVQGGVELIDELKNFRADFEKLRALYSQGRVSLEGEWAFNRSWDPVAWMSHDTWLRVKCDAVVFVDGETAIVIDFKSGKRYGNEIKHAEQMQLYQLSCFVKFPSLKNITVELWYTDLDELVRTSYRRDQGMKFAPTWESRVEALTTCEDFPPNPNRFSCKWCPYKPTEKGGTGHCSVGV